MDLIRKTLKTLINDEPKYIQVITEYPHKSKTKDFQYFKQLNFFEECNSERTYLIIKQLLTTKGIRTIHPVWFFIHKKRFEKDSFIFEEDIKNNIDVLDIKIPKNVRIPHRIQITKTLEIYYSLILNIKIQKCFMDKKSKFSINYPEFKDLWTSFYFPQIENKCNRKYIDFTYNFNGVIESIHLEINEPHHNVSRDKLRENEIYFNSNNRLIHYYVNKDTLDTILGKVFFRLSKSIFNVNKFAGLSFNAFINDIIDNLELVIFFSDLKKICQDKKLTWKLFVEKCLLVEIDIKTNFISIVNKEVEHLEDELDKKEKLNKLFYNYNTLDNKTLLKETGYDFYLMSINYENSVDSLDIKCMYSMYRQEYEKIMTTLLSNENTEKEMLLKHANLQLKRERTKFDKFKEHIMSGFKLVKKID